MPIINTIGNASGRAYGFTRGGAGKILISSTPGPAATITTYTGYIVFKFTASATLNVGAGAPGTADVFVVAGGSSGSPTTPIEIGGDGGAGGRTTASPSFAITANSPIPVVVGSTGTNSTFGPVTSSGGSAGGVGSGGQVNTSSLPGGDGPTNDYLTGSSQNWSGGGAGGSGMRSAPIATPAYPAGSGGATGGGPGGTGRKSNPIPSGYSPTPATPGSPGTANTGGGGGGGGSNPNVLPVASGGTGGSGVVIARFPDTQFRTS